MIDTHLIADYRNDLLKVLTKMEGFKQDPYFDSVGIVTIGYGFRINGVRHDY